MEASKIYGTLNNILDIDVKNDTVKTHGSLSRNLRRVRQGLDLIRALFKNFLSSEYVPLLHSIFIFPNSLYHCNLRTKIWIPCCSGSLMYSVLLGIFESPFIYCRWLCTISNKRHSPFIDIMVKSGRVTVWLRVVVLQCIALLLAYLFQCFLLKN